MKRRQFRRTDAPRGREAGYGQVTTWARSRRRLLGAACAAAAFAATPNLGNLSAEGETRTLQFFHTHTGESTTITFRRNGQYDPQALEQLNQFLRDWRVNEPARMDPRLFDILWEVYRASGSRQPINIISAYRSPETNAALRRRSSAVSEHSQHMLGKAMDIRLPDVETGRLREIAMKMQYGGVGYYPSSAFVHVDTGNVRAWPRMSQEQLARLFPDGKTLHLPSNGRPLAGYELAKAEIPARNAALASASAGPSLGGIVASLFKRETPPTPPARETTVLAYAAPPPLAEPRAFAPLPPLRPPVASRPIPVPAPTAVLGFDPPAAARALFEQAPSHPQDGFSVAWRDELSTTRFSGPAVKPLAAIRQAQADL